MNYETAKIKLTTIPQVMHAYNMYEIDLATKNKLLKDLKEKAKKITEEAGNPNRRNGHYE